MKEELSIDLDRDTLSNAHGDMQVYLQLLRNELREDFEANALTNRLTEKQKALLPLYALMLSAHSVYNLQDLQTEFVGYVQRIAEQRR